MTGAQPLSVSRACAPTIEICSALTVRFFFPRLQADSGLFESFEKVQHMSAAASPSFRMPQLAQTNFHFGGASSAVGKYGIPLTGSLPGDNV